MNKSQLKGRSADVVLLDEFASPRDSEAIKAITDDLEKTDLWPGDVVLFTNNDNTLLRGIIWGKVNIVRMYKIRVNASPGGSHQYPREKITPLGLNIFDCGVLKRDE